MQIRPIGHHWVEWITYAFGLSEDEFSTAEEPMLSCIKKRGVRNWGGERRLERKNSRSFCWRKAGSRGRAVSLGCKLA